MSKSEQQRAQIAAQVLTALISCPYAIEGSMQRMPAQLARVAVQYVDALMAELSKKK